MNKKISDLILLSFKILFFVTPLLMFDKTSELFELNKMLFIYLCAVLIGALWITKMIVSEKIELPKTPLDVPIYLFLAALVASTLLSIDRHTSIFGYYGRFNGGLLSIATYIFLFYAFVANIKKEDVLSVVKASIISSLVSILWGLPGVFGYDLTCLLFTHTLSTSCWTSQFDPTVRMFSTLGQPNWFGAFVAINFFLGLYYYLRKAYSSVPLATAFLCLSFAVVLLTRSRSALLAVVACLGVFLLAISRHSGKSRHSGTRPESSQFLLMRLWASQSDGVQDLLKLFILLLIPLFIIKTGVPKIDRFLSLPQAKQSDEQDQTHITTPGVTDSLDIRKIVWKGGIELGKKYPLFGTGVETFAYAYPQTRPVEHNNTSEWDFVYNKAHNEYINYFATTGLAGLMTYLALIGAFFYWIWRQLKHNRNDTLFIMTVVSAYVTILITNFFGFSTTTVNLLFYLLPAFAFVYAMNLQTKIFPLPRFAKLEQNKKIQFVSPALIVLTGFYFVVTSLMADISFALGDGYLRGQEYDRSIVYLENALSLRNEHLYHDRLSQAFGNRAYIEGFLDDKSATVSADIILSQKHSKTATMMSPKNSLYWRTSAKNNYLFYQLTNDEHFLKSAVQSIQQAQKLASTDPRFLYTEALFYSTKSKPISQDFDKAIKLLAKAIALKTNYRDAYFLKGTVYKNQKKNAEAKQEFEYILKNIAPDDAEAIEELKGLK